MKRFCFFGVFFVCLFGCAAFGVGGDVGLSTDSDTDGSAGHPYLIEDFADFEEFTADPNYWKADVYTELKCDLDLDPDLPGRVVYPYAPISPVIPNIAFYQYQGVFEGNGHVVSNMQIIGSTNLGLFGRIDSSGSVSNLAVDSGSITGSDRTVGGFCGSNYGVIKNCSANVSVTGTTAAASLIGGFIASNNGTIINCYSTGDVTGNEYVGGFVGIHKSQMSSIQDCYSTGDVTGNKSVGGFAGEISSDVSYCYSTGKVTKGPDSSYDFGGFCGLIYNFGSISNCFWDTETSGIEYTGDDTLRGVGLSTTEMETLSTYVDAGWRFPDLQSGYPGAWVFEAGSYPRLASFGITGTATVPVVEGMAEGQCRAALTDAGFTVGDVINVNSLTVESGQVVGLSVYEGGTVEISNSIDIYISLGSSGDGSAGDPWPVACAGDLEAINNDLTACYYMTNDIYLALGKTYSAAVIGAGNSLKFSGSFDGEGFSVKNLIIDGQGYLGFFSYIDETGIVRNVNIDDCWVGSNYNSSSDYLGALCGYNNGQILNCKSSGEIFRGSKSGGICGFNYGIISGCGSSCRLENGVDVGGICGHNIGEILKCSSQSKIIHGRNRGGICGYNGLDNYTNDFEGFIEYCSSEAVLEDQGESTGGICGFQELGRIRNCYSKATINSLNGYTSGGICGISEGGFISNCYACGEMEWLSNGICGHGPDNYSSSSSGCFWDAEKDGSIFTNPGDIEDGAKGKSTAEMKDIETYIEAGWEFADLNDGSGIWYMPEDSYPVLAFFDAEVEGSAVIPDVTGMELEDCRNSLTEAGLTIGRVYYVNSLTVESGKTASLSVHIGGLLRTDIAIDIYISQGISGDGTESQPWPIACQADLDAVNDDLTACYVMVNDIHMQTDKYYVTAVIAKDYDNRFTGKFDGDGHRIYNLKIHGGNYAGLFGIFGTNANLSTISNLGIENCVINGGGNVGGICGRNEYGSITNCYVKGRLVGNYVGGICGFNVDYGSKIQDCYAFAKIGGHDYNKGGICGRNGGAITNCYSNGIPLGTDYGIGLCNNDGGIITNSFWNVDLDGSEGSSSGDNHGGAIGKTSAELKTLSTFVDAGWDIADFEAGTKGWYLREDDYPRLYFENAQAGQIPYVRGLSESDANALLTDADFSVDETVMVSSLSIPAGQVAGLSVREGVFYHQDKHLTVYVSSGAGVADGSKGKPWPIASQSDLEYMANHTELYGDSFIMTTDVIIDARTVYTSALIAPETGPSGGAFDGLEFGGSFNGKGHIIKNMNIRGEGAYFGLFGCIGEGSEVKNVGLDNISVSRISGGDSLGGLCGFNSNGFISNCYTTGKISGKIFCGGICGKNSGVIIDSFSDISIRGDSLIAGLCGFNSGDIVRCYTTGIVSENGIGSDNIGGLCGVNYGNIIESYSKCSVKGFYYIGGLCGTNSGDILNSYSKCVIYANNTVGGICGSNGGVIENCYSSSEWSPEMLESYKQLLGVIGDNYGSISNSFWNVDLDGSEDSQSGEMGKTSVELKALSTFTDAGWDFVGEFVNGDADVWRLCVDGSGYPRLAWEFYSRGDFVCGDGVDADDFAYFEDRYLCDGCGGIFGSAGGTVDIAVLARVADMWLSVGCGDCGGGDVSGGGDVDMADFGKVASEWLCTAPVNWDRCDLDGDGVVGDDDLSIWIGYWLE